MCRAEHLARALSRADVPGCVGYGKVRVRAWAKLHPKVQMHAGRGSRGPRPIVHGTLVLVEVERLPRGESRREPGVLWLWWYAPEPEIRPEILELLWRAYTLGAWTWSTPSASSSRRSGGLPLACATPSRPSAGGGWFSALTRSS